MVGKKLSVTDTLHGIVVILWVVGSVIVFGTVCIAVWPFNAQTARRVGLLWNRLFLRIAGIRVEVSGLEKLNPEKRYIFIANHQSHLDIPVLIGTMRHQLSFIAKKELFAIPFFGWGMYVLGHIWIDRANARKAHVSIQRAIKRLRKDNISLVLFPEGTRSLDGTVGHFRQGSFSLAQQAGVELVPLAIQNTSQLLPKHGIIVKRGMVQLTICDPIPVSESMTKTDISEMVRGVIKGVITGTNG